MSKLSRAVMGGLLFAFWLMCFVFPISLIQNFPDANSVGSFLGQMVVDFFVLWFICGAIAHGVIGLFDDLNKRGPRDHDNPDGRGGNADHQPGGDQSKDTKHEDDQTPKQ